MSTNFQPAARAAFGLHCRIWGSGAFALATRCGESTQVMLFHTADARNTKFDEWKNTNCIAGSGACCNHHFLKDFPVPTETPAPRGNGLGDWHD